MAMLHRYIRAQLHFPSSDSLFPTLAVGRVSLYSSLGPQLFTPHLFLCTPLLLTLFGQSFKFFFFFLHAERCVHRLSSTPRPSPLGARTTLLAVLIPTPTTTEWQWFIVTLQSAVCVSVRARARVFA